MLNEAYEFLKQVDLKWAAVTKRHEPDHVDVIQMSKNNMKRSKARKSSSPHIQISPSELFKLFTHADKDKHAHHTVTLLREKPQDATLQNIKCVIIGKAEVGKTSFWTTFTTRRFPSEYIPTVYDQHTVNLKVDLASQTNLVTMDIWDTSGHDDYERLRPLSYLQTDVVILMFDVTSMSSLDEICDIWHPEVTHFCRGVPVILAGNKIDLRKDNKVRLKTGWHFSVSNT